MFESLFFLAIVGVILYVTFWAMIKDDGQRSWWEDYRNSPESQDEDGAGEGNNDDGANADTD